MNKLNELRFECTQAQKRNWILILKLIDKKWKKKKREN